MPDVLLHVFEYGTLKPVEVTLRGLGWEEE
jgi:hypothetical protein